MTTSPALQTADEALSAAGVDPGTGLSSVEAASRLVSHGPNELRSQPREAAWRRFLKQFADPLVYLLFGAMVISLAAWFLEGASGLPIDVVVFPSPAGVGETAVTKTIRESRSGRPRR